MRFKFSLLLLAVASVATTGAEEVRQVEAHLKFVSTTRPLLGVGILHNKKTEGLVIPTDMLSDEVIYRGPARLELIEINQAPNPSDAKPSEAKLPEAKSLGSSRPARGVKAREPSVSFVSAGKPPLAWIDLPSNQGRLNLILLVTPGVGNGMTALPDAPGTFPMGSNRYINLCPFTIEVSTPSGRQAIASGESKVILPGAKNNDYYDLQIHVEPENTPRLVLSSRVFYMENVRKLYLITPVVDNREAVLVTDIEDRSPVTKGQGMTKTAPKAAK